MPRRFQSPYPGEFLRQAVALVRNGRNAYEVGRELGVFAGRSGRPDHRGTRGAGTAAPEAEAVPDMVQRTFKANAPTGSGWPTSRT